MNKKEVFINNLQKEKISVLLNHFNSLYKKKHSELTENEVSIIYLAWLWKNGMVIKDQTGFYSFNEADAGVSLSDYENIPFHEEIYFPGSYNLESIHMDYNLDQLIQIL